MPPRQGRGRPRRRGVAARVLERELVGQAGGRGAARAAQQSAFATLDLSSHELRSLHKSGVMWLDVDPAEGRYLLSAARDSTIAVYDLRRPTASTAASAVHDPVLFIDRHGPGAHKFAVSACCWYPIDSGLFVTGSFDKRVKLWDTNEGVVACEFPALGRVHSIAMSCPGGLIAVGSDDARVQICDPISGAAVHTLSGHRSATWATCWLPGGDHMLATGSADGEVRVWDVRRSGTLFVLDKGRTAMDASLSDRTAIHRVMQGGEGPTWLRGAGGGGRVGKAHDGGVTGLQVSPCGLYLVSSGRDSQARLWDAFTGLHQMVAYQGAMNSREGGLRFAVGSDPRCLLHPSGRHILPFSLLDGRPSRPLSGHLDTATACCLAPGAGLVSGGEDSLLLWWTPGGAGRELPEEAVAGIDVDRWSPDLEAFPEDRGE